MCADDLLSVLLYLLVKTEVPNWYVIIFWLYRAQSYHLVCNAAVGANVSEHAVITYTFSKRG